MQDFVQVTGIILKSVASGESNRRITILTNSRGKISAFARGACKPNSRFAASTCSLAFGNFKLSEGREAYNLIDAEISNYFESFRTDIEGSLYASYFCEIADYYCRENNDEREMMKLLYQSLRALQSPSLPNALVRCVFELKSLAVNGEYPGPPTQSNLSDSARYAMEYVGTSSVERLYTFNLTDSVLAEVSEIATSYRNRYMNHHFKSLEILDTLC